MINMIKPSASMMLNPQQRAKQQQQMLLTLAAFSVILLALFMPDLAQAYTGDSTGLTKYNAGSATEGDAFGEIWIQISRWITGTLGKIIVGSMILVGIIMGVVRQSMMAFAVGVGAGIGLYNIPNLIDGIMRGASAEAVNAATIAVQAINNGLVPF